MTAISAVDIALWTYWANPLNNLSIGYWVGEQKAVPVYASRLYSMPLDELRVEAQRF